MHCYLQVMIEDKYEGYDTVIEKFGAILKL